MKPAVLKRFPEFKEHSSEGGVPHMYVDITNNVTVGIGCLLSDTRDAKKAVKATAGYWYVEGAPGTKPTDEMVEADYNACMKLNQEMGGNVKSRAFKAVTKLRLSEKGIEIFTQRKMIAKEGTLFETISREQWEAFPVDAQFFCIAVMWGIGNWSTVVRLHPALTTAIKNEDFLEAAKHVNFKSNGNEKVRKFLNKSYAFLLANAAASMPKGCRSGVDKKPAYFLNPNLLYWPSKWEYDAESEMALEADWMGERP